MPLGLMFIDLNNRAFDSVKHETVREAPRKQGVSRDTVEILEKMYEKATAYVSQKFKKG